MVQAEESRIMLVVERERSSLYVLVFMFIILSLSLLYPKFWLLNTMCGARTLFEPCNNLSLLSLVACGSYQCYVSWLFVSDAMLLLCHLKCITCHMHHGYFMTLVLAPLGKDIYVALSLYLICA